MVTVLKKLEKNLSDLNPKLIKQVNRLIPRNYEKLLDKSFDNAGKILPYLRNLEKEMYDNFISSKTGIQTTKKYDVLIKKYTNRKTPEKKKVDYLQKELLKTSIENLTREMLLYEILGSMHTMLAPYIQKKVDLSLYTPTKKISKSRKVDSHTILTETLKTLNKAVEEAVKKSGQNVSDKIEQRIFGKAYKYGLIEKEKGDHTSKFERIKKVNNEFGSPLSNEYLKNNKDDLENRMQSFEQRIIQQQINRKRKKIL